MDPTLEEVNDIKTAVSEAVTNAIVHAYPDTLGKIVMKLCILEGNVLEIVVKDWGIGIPDVEQARTPLFTTGSEDRSGMGFTIMESFMDLLRVRSTPGKGTIVTMRRKIARRVGR
jgi:stage II sporulation protein AB (anti-sigma F factor)